MRLTAHQHGVPLNATDDDLKRFGGEALYGAATARNLVVVSDPVVIVNEPAVFVVDGQYEGWYPVSDPSVGDKWGQPEFRTIIWEAQAEPSPEAVPAVGAVQVDGSIHFTVPTLLIQQGGNVRCVHGVAGPVIVDAFRHDHSPIGYAAAFTITDTETEVQVVPGTAMIRVTKTVDDGE